MCSFILFSLYTKDLLKYKNCYKKICFQRGPEFIKKHVIYNKEKSHLKSGTATKVK